MMSRSVSRRLGVLAGASLRRPAAYDSFRPIYAISGQLSDCRFLASTSPNTKAPTQAAHSAPSRSSQVTSSVLEDISERLPSLPVPRLDETLERLKETIWPVAMNSSEFAQALRLIEAFAASPGQKLDLLLRAKASQTKNWLTNDWWLEEAYLKSRDPLVINSNPALIYPQLPFEVSDQRSLISTCAQLISSIIECKLALQRGWNPEAAAFVDQQEFNSNLCHDQYRRIFGSTRFPGEHIDEFRPYEMREDENNFNLICTFRGQFYEIQLDDVTKSEQGRVEALENVLSKIIRSSPASEETDIEGPGILTTMRRDRWAESIKLLDPDSLQAIERSHLLLSLDTIPREPRDKYASAFVHGQSSSNESYLSALTRQVLHGDRANVGNRWFDKSLQLIVVADAECSRLLGAGLNYEHCIGEAIVLTRLIESSYTKLLELHQQRHSSLLSGTSVSDATAVFRQLQMVPPENKETLFGSLQKARQDFVSQIEQFDLNYFDYRKYGRDQIKAWRFSPDSWFQVALQLAHYQLHHRLTPCYESASTRQFAYGRTETIRSLTKDVAQFCFEPNFTNMQAAANSHKNYAVAANNASAIDRVLFGYRMTFNQLKANQWTWGVPRLASPEESHGHPLKFNSLADTERRQRVEITDLFTEKELNILGAFFNNELFDRARRFGLSTSQVSSLEHPEICTSYGPLVPDGYACCYNLSRERIVAAIAANSSNQSFSCEASKFAESLGRSLDRMQDIVTESQQQQYRRDVDQEKRKQKQ